MINSKKYYYVVNIRLTYVSTQLLLEWAGLSSSKVLYASFYDINKKIDDFLFQYVDHDDIICVIGFDTALVDNMKRTYKNYMFVSFNSDGSYKNVFEHVLTTVVLPKIDALHLTDGQRKYIKMIYGLLNNDYSLKETYLLSILFYNVSVEVFYNYYSHGYKESDKFTKIIMSHIHAFNKEDHTVYEYGGYYFVNSKVKFLGDFVYKYHNMYDNINVIDTQMRRVYFRQLKSDGKDINKLCSIVCDDVREFNGFCSGAITDKFMKLTTKMTPTDYA